MRNKFIKSSDAEELIMIKEWKKTKDQDTLSKIIANHYLMIHSLVNQYALDINKDDLISEGVLGILCAIEKFDIDKNVRFSTYAYFWIKARILKAIKKINPLIDNIKTKNKKEKDLKKKKENHFEDLDFIHIEDSDNFLSEKISSINKSRVISMDFQESGDFIDYGIFKENQEDSEINQDFEKILRLSLLTLTKKEQIILENRWLKDDNLTFLEISQMLNLSQERIRQIEKEILKKLKNTLEKSIGSLEGTIKFAIINFYLKKLLSNID